MRDEEGLIEIVIELSVSQPFLNKIATENTYASLIFENGRILFLTIHQFLQVTIQVFLLLCRP